MQQVPSKVGIYIRHTTNDFQYCRNILFKPVGNLNYQTRQYETDRIIPVLANVMVYMCG